MHGPVFLAESSNDDREAYGFLDSLMGQKKKTGPSRGPDLFGVVTMSAAGVCNNIVCEMIDLLWTKHNRCSPFSSKMQVRLYFSRSNNRMGLRISA